MREIYYSNASFHISISIKYESEFIRSGIIIMYVINIQITFAMLNYESFRNGRISILLNRLSHFFDLLHFSTISAHAAFVSYSLCLNHTPEHPRGSESQSAAALSTPPFVFIVCHRTSACARNRSCTRWWIVFLCNCATIIVSRCLGG